MNPGLLVFGEDWGRHPSSTQHLIARLAPDWPVVWVNSLGLRRPRLSDLGRVLDKGHRMLANAASAAANRTGKPPPFPVVEPPALPLPGNPLAGLWNRWAVGRKVGTVARAHGLKRPILWSSLPTAAPLVGAFDAAAVVYYAGDDFGALSGVDHGPVLREERKLAERADLIIAASGEIAARFDPARTRILPHGVDLSLFTRPAAWPADLPEDRPVAGFYGSLSDWVDWPLVAEVARRLPHWQFLLIGSERTDLSCLDGLSNIRRLGPRPHEALPGYVRHWTASLLPFRKTDQIMASNPLKLREYLAAGRPVVSTWFPALAPYHGGIRVAHDADCFARALEDSRWDTRQETDHRIGLVKDEDWAVRARQLGGWLSDLV